MLALLVVSTSSALVAEPADAVVRIHTCVTAGDLQAVIDAAAPGDVIEIAAGVCTGKAYPAEDFVIEKDIVVRGAGAGLTVLQGSGAPNSRVVGIHADATIEGVTITGGTINQDNAGGGVINDATATLIGVEVVGNEAGSGRHRKRDREKYQGAEGRRHG